MLQDKRWRWTLVLGIVVPVALGCYLVYASAQLTGGRFVYFMDDAYIHMGVAKNWLVNGTLGINEKGWTNLTSSPLYTLLLIVLLKGTGGSDQILWPLAMGVWAALVLSMGAAFYRYGYSLRAFQAYVIILALCLPITYAFLHGMEHIIHVWLTSLLLIHWQGPCNAPARPTKPALPNWALAGIAALAMLARFETLMLTGLLGIVDLSHRRYRRVAWLAAATVVLPLAFMYWMHAEGASFVPNSISVKSKLDASTARALLRGLTRRTMGNIHQVYHYWLLVVSTVVLVSALFMQKSWDKMAPLFVAAGCTLASLVLTLQDDANRYDMWLFGLMLLGGVLLVDSSCKPLSFGWFWIGLTVLAGCSLLFWRLLPSQILPYGAAFILMAGVCLLYVYRQWSASQDTQGLILPVGVMLLVSAVARFGYTLPYVTQLSANVYGQQMVMASFVKTYYDGCPVVLNDIGTTAFFTKSPIIDRAGLATTDMVSIIQRHGDRNSITLAEPIDSLARARKACLAILYPDWLRHPPKAWRKVATLTTQPVLGLLGDSTVAFYAFSASDAARIQRELAAYRSRIPARAKLRLLPADSL